MYSSLTELSPYLSRGPARVFVCQVSRFLFLPFVLGAFLIVPTMQQINVVLVVQNSCGYTWGASGKPQLSQRIDESLNNRAAKGWVSVLI